MPQNKHNQHHQMSGYRGWHQDHIQQSTYQQQMTYAMGNLDQNYQPPVSRGIATLHPQQQYAQGQVQLQAMRQQQGQMPGMQQGGQGQGQGQNQQQQGQSQQQQQQQQMKQQIQQQYQGQYSQLSTKDFNYLKDHMSWELLAMKKCAHYAAECQDMQVSSLINQVGQMHARHYNTLLSYVNPQVVQ
jgi:hypothetical protein